MCQGLACFNLC